MAAAASPEGAGASGAAFAPGHVTGIFLPEITAPDPLARGSRGAGVVLDLGARARAQVWPVPPGRGTVEVTERGRPVHLPITERALALLPGAGEHLLRVDVVHELPVAQGLSMSAAGSLAAATAAAHALGLPASSAAEAAHRAELDLHGGLGGVAAILGGGLEVRRAPGLPPLGVVERTPLRTGFFLATTGEALPSPPLLSDPAFLERVRRAAERAIPELPSPPVPWETALLIFERFTDELRLAPPPLEETIRHLRSQGVHAVQAMLGNTLLLWSPDEEGEARALTLARRSHLTPWRVHVGSRGATPVLLHPP